MPAPIDAYRIIADPGMSPADKQSALDMLYSGGTAPAPMPDARTAQVDPNSIMAGSGALNPVASMPAEAPPAPPPVATDAGGMSGGMSAPPAPVMTEAPMSIAPERTVEAPAAPGVAVAAPQPSPDDVMNETIGRAIAQEARGYGGVRVAAHDQPISTSLTQQAAVPEEMKDKIRGSQQAEQGLTLEQGDIGAKNKEEEAAALDDVAFRQEVDENAYNFEQKAREKQFKQAQDDFAKLVEDTKAQPGEWWSSKSTGNKVTTLLSALLFGLARDDTGLDNAIKADAERRELNRGRKLNAAHERLVDLQTRLASPDAARQLSLSMSYRTAATEMQRLGAAAQAPEIRARAAAAAQEMNTKANILEADGWAKEHGVSTTQIAHIPNRVVGGRAPNILRAVKEAKEAGLNPEGALRAATGGQYGSGESPDEAKRRVVFDDGTVGYVGNEGQQGEAQQTVSAIGGLKTTYQRIKQLMASPGHTIAGKDKAELDANIAAAMRQLQSASKGEGANARMAGEMLEKLAPLTGANAVSTGMTDAAAKAQIDEALRIVSDDEDRIRGILTPSPKTAPSGGKIRTLASGDSEAAAEHGAVAKE